MIWGQASCYRVRLVYVKCMSYKKTIDYVTVKGYSLLNDSFLFLLSNFTVMVFSGQFEVVFGGGRRVKCLNLTHELAVKKLVKPFIYLKQSFCVSM